MIRLQTGLRLIVVVGNAALAGIWASNDTQIDSGTRCRARASIVQQLTDDYGESERAIGSAFAGRVIVELFEAGDHRTWAMLASFPDGQSCFLIGGTDWQGTGPTSSGPDARQYFRQALEPARYGARVTTSEGADKFVKRYAGETAEVP